ncbi:MAG: helix-turn-helix transcriptional regulator [Chloroflexaceae bacterium]|nr:helix-turn-helix transcriptional regulator [Chloroflexaceae bacterium]
MQYWPIIGERVLNAGTSVANLVLAPIAAFSASPVLFLAFGGGVLFCLAPFSLSFRRPRRQQARTVATAPAASLAWTPEHLRRLRCAANIGLVELGMRTGIPARQLAEIEFGLRMLAPGQAERIAGAIRGMPQAA